MRILRLAIVRHIFRPSPKAVFYERDVSKKNYPDAGDQHYSSTASQRRTRKPRDTTLAFTPLFELLFYFPRISLLVKRGHEK